MSFGNNFLLMDVLPNTSTTAKKVEKEANSDLTFYFENIRFHKDNRVFFTGTASSQNYDGGQKHAFIKIIRKNNGSSG